MLFEMDSPCQRTLTTTFASTMLSEMDLPLQRTYILRPQFENEQLPSSLRQLLEKERLEKKQLEKQLKV